MKHRELTKAIIGRAYEVYNEMGYGFLESVYETCLMFELRKADLRVEKQKPIDVYYKGHPVGAFQADLMVDKKIIIELKCIETIRKPHEIQLVNYLNATEMKVGLLLNFTRQAVDVTRKVQNVKEC